jgi:hypothetical protein
MRAESRNSGKNKVAIARKRRGEHMTAATNKHSKIEELLDTLFSMRFMPKLYGEHHRKKLVLSHMSEVGVLESTVNYKKTELRGLNPQTNYTDRATAACRRS